MKRVALAPKAKAPAMPALTPKAPDLPAPNEVVGERLVFRMELCERVGRTYQCIWYWMQQGKFPRARDFNGRPAWLESELVEYLNKLPVKRLKGDK
jgi:predicted DNA-binding transcriptional regulator AlpA